MSTELFGLYRGIVLSNIDPRNRGHLLVSIPVVTGSAGVYAEPCLAPGGGGIPYEGSGVWIMFEGGSSSNPVWMGVFFTPPTDGGSG